MKKIYPSPEAILEGRWDITSGQPRVDIKNRHMWLDLRNDHSWACVRAHELAHATFTPEITSISGDIDPMCFQAVEDCRVNYLANQAGIDFSAGSPRDVVKGAVISMMAVLRPNYMAGLIIAAFDNEDRGRVLNVLRENAVSPEQKACLGKAKYLADTARSMFWDEDWTFDNTLRIAKWLSDNDGNDEDEEKETYKGESYVPESLKGEWGEMVIERPPLHNSKKSRGKGLDMEGDMLKAPWRVTSDMRVFRARKAFPNGTIVVDASGSMNLDMDDLQKMVKVIPIGQIAAYTTYTDVKGFLRIMGKNGRVVGPEAYNDLGQGNLVDGPALEWLGKQQSPRIWVSDGQVIGLRGSSVGLREDIQKLKKKYRITQVGTVDEAVAMLKGRK